MWIWNFIQFLIYDLPYFLYRSADNFKIEGLLVFIAYQIGRISGMRLFRKFLEGHFPYFRSEDDDFKLWIIKQIELLGGNPFVPSRKYYKAIGLLNRQAKNLDTSMKQSQVVNEREGKKMAKKKLVIDPGHGGTDGGARSVTGVWEKDINLNTALKIKELLKDNPNIDLLLTRETDVFIKLGDRVKKAAKFKADLFYSIHVNSWQLESTGTETEYSRDECIPAAQILHKYLLQATGFKDRGIHKQSIQVTRETKMPAALAEPGFLSNPVEEAVLISPEFAERYALAVAKAACEFLGVPYEVVPNAPLGTFPMPIMLGDIQFNGFIIDGKSWVPAKDVLNALGVVMWTFKGKSVLVNGIELETKIINGTGYVKATDLKALDILLNVMMEPDTTNPKRVLLFPKEVIQNG